MDIPFPVHPIKLASEDSPEDLYMFVNKVPLSGGWQAAALTCTYDVGYELYASLPLVSQGLT